MFNHTHYIPILRWKRGEWIALRNLDVGVKARMVPLVELVPKDFAPRRCGNPHSVDRVLFQKVKEISENCGKAPFFVDLWLLNPNLRSTNSTHPLEKLAMDARAQQLSLIPVTGLKRSIDYQSAVASIARTDDRGVCIRVHLDDIQRSSFQSALGQLLSYLKLQPEEVDFLADYQVIDNSSPSLGSLCKGLPSIGRWRTFTMASGAFPKDLTGFTLGQHLLLRLDWRVWRDQVTASATLPRRPAYGDYTIQHPIFSEPPERANFSASIRYTTDKHWVIMRGEGVFNDDSPGFAQWPANAQLLCGRSEFCGADFSYGDEYIEQMSLQTEKTGSAETWLRAGINHHLTFVVRQIASLFGI